jgi:hypothetical protein
VRLYDLSINALTREEIDAPGFSHSDPKYKNRPYPTWISWGMGFSIPLVSSVCPVCKKKWSLENCHDVWMTSGIEDIKLDKYVGLTLKEFSRCILRHKNKRMLLCSGSERFIRNDKYIDLRPRPDYSFMKINERGWVDKKEVGERDSYVIQPGDETYAYYWIYYHMDCWKTKREKEEREYFIDIIKKTGINVLRMKKIENEYSSYDGYAPWYLVTAKFNTGEAVFKIGWRKRVINIEFMNVGKQMSVESLFPKEDVTKGAKYIHAWGTEKCIEYLTEIKGYLDEF